MPQPGATNTPLSSPDRSWLVLGSTQGLGDLINSALHPSYVQAQEFIDCIHDPGFALDRQKIIEAARQALNECGEDGADYAMLKILAEISGRSRQTDFVSLLKGARMAVPHLSSSQIQNTAKTAYDGLHAANTKSRTLIEQVEHDQSMRRRHGEEDPRWTKVRDRRLEEAKFYMALLAKAAPLLPPSEECRLYLSFLQKKAHHKISEALHAEASLFLAAACHAPRSRSAGAEEGQDPLPRRGPSRTTPHDPQELHFAVERILQDTSREDRGIDFRSLSSAMSKLGAQAGQNELSYIAETLLYRLEKEPQRERTVRAPGFRHREDDGDYSSSSAEDPDELSFRRVSQLGLLGIVRQEHSDRKLRRRTIFGRPPIEPERELWIKWAEHRVEKAAFYVRILGLAARRLENIEARIRYADHLLGWLKPRAPKLRGAVLNALGRLALSAPADRQIKYFLEARRSVKSFSESGAWSALRNSLPEAIGQIPLPETKADEKAFWDTLEPLLSLEDEGLASAAFRRLKDYVSLQPKDRWRAISENLGLITEDDSTPFAPRSIFTGRSEYPHSSLKAVCAYLTFCAVNGGDKHVRQIHAEELLKIDLLFSKPEERETWGLWSFHRSFKAVLLAAKQLGDPQWVSKVAGMISERVELEHKHEFHILSPQGAQSLAKALFCLFPFEEPALIAHQLRALSRHNLDFEQVLSSIPEQRQPAIRALLSENLAKLEAQKNAHALIDFVTSAEGRRLRYGREESDPSRAQTSAKAALLAARCGLEDIKEVIAWALKQKEEQTGILRLLFPPPGQEPSPSGRLPFAGHAGVLLEPVLADLRAFDADSLEHHGRKTTALAALGLIGRHCRLAEDLKELAQIAAVDWLKNPYVSIRAQAISSLALLSGNLPEAERLEFSQKVAALQDDTRVIEEVERFLCEMALAAGTNDAARQHLELALRPLVCGRSRQDEYGARAVCACSQIVLALKRCPESRLPAFCSMVKEAVHKAFAKPDSLAAGHLRGAAELMAAAPEEDRLDFGRLILGALSRARHTFLRQDIDEIANGFSGLAPAKKEELVLFALKAFQEPEKTTFPGADNLERVLSFPQLWQGIASETLIRCLAQSLELLPKKRREPWAPIPRVAAVILGARPDLEEAWGKMLSQKE